MPQTGKSTPKAALKGEIFKRLLIDWKWIWGYTARHRGAVTVYAVMGVLSSAVALASGVASKYLIDKIVALDASGIPLIAVITVVGAAVSLLFRSLTSRLSARLSVDMHNDVQGDVFRRLIKSDWVSLVKYPSGELVNRFSADIGSISSGAVSFLPSIIIQSFTVVAVLGVILYYDPIMALIGCASTPIMALLSRKFIGRQRSFSLKMREVSGEMSAFEAEVFRNIDTLKGLGAEENIEKSLDSLQEKYRQTALKFNSFHIKTNVLLGVMSSAVQYLALGYCLWRLWRGDILFGTMVLFLQQRSVLSGAFSSLIGLIPTALSCSVSAQRIRELCELEKEEGSGRIPPEPGFSVSVEGVCAGYGKDSVVLKNADFKAKAGEITVLTGASGEGKTTLIRLLLGLIKQSEGEAFLESDKGERHNLGPDTRSFFAYVPQGNTLIAGSIADNLRLADAAADDATLKEALKTACADGFVAKMPEGINTCISEGGKGLSEGQSQRIAIARALVAKKPIMLLDEITSALDIPTEERVLKNLMEKGVTCIVTTHRPTVLAMSHRVYNVEDGKIVSEK